MEQNNIRFRTAEWEDLPAIVQMLAEDILGSAREVVDSPLPAAYEEAFLHIQKDHNNTCIVACKNEEIVGYMQITYIPCLSHQGAWRANFENIRVKKNMRGGGIGTAMLQFALAAAKARECRVVQLTTDKERKDARRFYEKLGFSATHEGMKLWL